MQFHGFSSIAAYECECARVGFTTERHTYHKGGEDYLLLITRSDTHSSTAVDMWNLFTVDETREVLSGVMPQGTGAAGQLAQHGYFSDDPADDPTPAPAWPEYYADGSAGDWQQYSLF